MVFNKQIKALCKMAGIDELVCGFKNNLKTRRKEIVDAPKYEFVTSHIMRRSLHLITMVKLKRHYLRILQGILKKVLF